MKGKKFSIANFCLMIVLAALIFAAWRILLDDTGNMIHIFDGDGLGESGINGGWGIIILVFLLAICNFLLVGATVYWLILGILCFFFGLAVLVSISTNKRFNRLRRCLSVYMGIASVIISLALFFIYAVLKGAASDRNFDYTAPLALLIAVVAVGIASIVINAFSLKEIKAYI